MSKTSKKRLKSAWVTFALSAVFFILGNRYIEQVAASRRPLFENFIDGLTSLFPAMIENPFHISFETEAMIGGMAFFFIVWLVWLQYLSFIGNYRDGEESGSATWGDEKDGVKYKDTDAEDNNLLFTDKYGLALGRKKFNLELDRNLNVMVIGGSGSGKTRNYVKPNLMQLNSSYFVTDPKGTLLPEMGYLFRDNGYKIKSFNTINFDQSMHWNPLKYVQTDADILSFVNCLIANTSGDGASGDPFWENAERLLYTALIALLRDWFPKEDYSLSGLLTLLSMAEAREEDESFKSPLDLLFLQIEEGRKYSERKGKTPQPFNDEDPYAVERERGLAVKAATEWSWEPSRFKRNSDGVEPSESGGLTSDDDFALDNYNAFKVAAGKTLKSIIISCNVRVKPLAIREVRELLKYDEMELDTLGDPGQKTIIFGILSDTDKTFSFLFAILMWQTIDQLCRKALTDYGGRLPTPVNFIFDEFANIGTIPDIEEKIAVVRSRNIGLSLILQSVAQLESRYEKTAKTLIDCCDTTLFLGGKSNSTNKEIAEMIGKETISQVTYNQTQGQNASATKNLQIQGRDLIDAAEIGKMSRRKAIVLIAGTNPLMDFKYQPDKHKRYKYIDPGHKGALYDENFDFVVYRKEQAKTKHRLSRKEGVVI